MVVLYIPSCRCNTDLKSAAEAIATVDGSDVPFADVMGTKATIVVNVASA